MKKILHSLMFTTSLVLVGGVLISFGSTTRADNWFTAFFNTANNAKSMYDDGKKIVNMGKEVVDDTKSTAKFFNVGQRVKDSSGAVGTVQSDGTVKTDAGEVLGKVNVKSGGSGGVSTSGTGTGSGSSPWTSDGLTKVDVDPETGTTLYSHDSLTKTVDTDGMFNTFRDGVDSEAVGEYLTGRSSQILPGGAGEVKTGSFLGMDITESDPNAVANAIQKAGLAGPQNTSGLTSAGQSGVQNVAGGGTNSSIVRLNDGNTYQIMENDGGGTILKNVQTGDIKSMSSSEYYSSLASNNTTPTGAVSKFYSVDDIQKLGDNTPFQLGTQSFQKTPGSDTWTNLSTGKTYTTQELSDMSKWASTDTSSWTTTDGYYNPTTKQWMDTDTYNQIANSGGDGPSAIEGFEKTAGFKDADGNFHTAAEKANIDSAKNEISGQRTEGDAGKGTEAEAEAEAAKGEASVWNHKAIVQNYLQYALLITAAALADNDWTETQTVKIKANLLEQTQGESGDGSVGSVSTLDGTTTADAAASMATLLANNAVNYDPLLSKEVDLSGLTGGLTGAGGTGSVVTSGTQYKKVIKRRRERLFQVYSTAASMIAAGSNAISSKFYDRLSLYIDGLMSTSGTLGALSTINDSERFVMFEMSRGAALSATELGFRATGTLRELDVLEEESHGS